MIGGVPASVGFGVVDACTFQNVGTGQYVLLLGITAHGDDVRVFDEKQAVATLTPLPFLDEFLLNPKGLAPIEASKIQHFTFPHTV